MTPRLRQFPVWPPGKTFDEYRHGPVNVEMHAGAQIFSFSSQDDRPVVTALVDTDMTLTEWRRFFWSFDGFDTTAHIDQLNKGKFLGTAAVPHPSGQELYLWELSK